LFALILLVGCSKVEEPNIEPEEDENEIIDEEENEVEVDVEAIARAFYKGYNEKNTDSLVNDYEYTTEMKTFMTAANIEGIYTQMALGEMIESQAMEVSNSGEYIIYAFPTIYENGSVNVNIVFQEDKIAGFNFGAFTGEELESTSEAFTEVELVANVNDMSLDGVLIKPAGMDQFPVVIIVHGSGPSSMNGSVGANTPYKDIAVALAEVGGIGSYRYDKSTYTYPERFEGDQEMTVYEETINDVVLIAEMIAAREDVSEVYILGHSLGGHLIPLIAKETDADGYIIMAGSYRPLQELVLQQYNYLSNLDGEVTEEEQDNIDYIEEIVARFEDIDSVGDGEMLLGAYKKYWEFLISYDVKAEALLIDKPVFVVQGERDYQVTMEDFNLWKEVGNDNFSFMSYSDLNHLMYPGEGAPNPSEYQIKAEISADLIKDIINWILGN
jgi:dienelactone hydrolase